MNTKRDISLNLDEMHRSCCSAVNISPASPEQIATISDRIGQWQEHADRNLALIDEHLLWCQSFDRRLDAIADFLDRVVRAIQDGNESMAFRRGH